jgi:hypothetical protein
VTGFALQHDPGSAGRHRASMPPARAARTRKRTRLAGALALAAWLAAPAAQAQSSARFMTAGELHQRLSASEPAAREAGRHYVLGVVDALALARDGRICLGAGVPAAQLVDTVAAQLQARPDLHRFNAASLVREAIFVAFPCT